MFCWAMKEVIRALGEKRAPYKRGVQINNPSIKSIL